MTNRFAINQIEDVKADIQGYSNMARSQTKKKDRMMIVFIRCLSFEEKSREEES